MLDNNAFLLRVTLQAAVPLWAHQFRDLPASELMRRAPELGQIIAEKGDIIQFKSKRKGETAKAFNALAQAMAILSFFPGGVCFMGDRYENRHPEFEHMPPAIVRLLASLPFARSKAPAVQAAHAELRDALDAGDSDRVRAAAERFRNAVAFDLTL